MPRTSGLQISSWFKSSSHTGNNRATPVSHVNPGSTQLMSTTSATPSSLKKKAAATGSTTTPTATTNNNTTTTSSRNTAGTGETMPPPTQSTAQAGQSAKPSDPPASRPPLMVARMTVTVHGLFDMPRLMAHLDPRRDQIEIVLKPKAKYYYEDHRVTQLELPEQAIAFSPSSILFRHERFVLDLDMLAAQHNPSQSSLQGTGVDTVGTTNSSDSFSTPTPAQGGRGDAYEESAMNLGSGTSLDPAQKPPASNSRFTTNKVLLEYPTREDLKVIIEIYVGVRQRRIGSSAVRWLTPSLEANSTTSTGAGGGTASAAQGSAGTAAAGGAGASGGAGGKSGGAAAGAANTTATTSSSSSSSDVASFAAAEAEVARQKVVSRFVGLTVGHLSCTMSLPHVQANLTQLPDSFGAITAAKDRLVLDADLLKRRYPTASVEPPTADQLHQRLLSGESELAVYKSMLLQFCPQYYVNRVEKIQHMYPPTSDTLDWVKESAAKLVEQELGNEEDLIRRLSAELGPELCSISPRIRRIVFRWYYRLDDAKMKRCVEEEYEGADDLLDEEPDLYMGVLVRHYGQEVPPTRYNFPGISYVPDERTYFIDTLRFPVNRPDGREREQALAARNQRIPLMLTPNERPLQPQEPPAPGRRVNEIDILLEKYRPEFAQIVPSIADAIETVVEQNDRLIRGGSGYGERDHRFDVFESTTTSYPYTTILNPLAEYTYISPSSMLAAVIYLDRLCLRHPKLVLTRFNVEKLFVTAVRIASKVVDLRSVNNRNFAHVFSLPTADMNRLEVDLLTLMNFDFFLSPEEFNNYARLVHPPVAYTQMRSSVQRYSVEADAAAATTAAVTTSGNPRSATTEPTTDAAYDSQQPQQQRTRESSPAKAAPSPPPAASSPSGPQSPASNRTPIGGGAVSSSGGALRRSAPGPRVLRTGSVSASANGGPMTSAGTAAGAEGDGVAGPSSSSSGPVMQAQRQVLANSYDASAAAMMEANGNDSGGALYHSQTAPQRYGGGSNGGGGTTAPPPILPQQMTTQTSASPPPQQQQQPVPPSQRPPPGHHPVRSSLTSIPAHIAGNVRDPAHNLPSAAISATTASKGEGCGFGTSGNLTDAPTASSSSPSGLTIVTSASPSTVRSATSTVAVGRNGQCAAATQQTQRSDNAVGGGARPAFSSSAMEPVTTLVPSPTASFRKERAVRTNSQPCQAPS